MLALSLLNNFSLFVLVTYMFDRCFVAFFILYKL